MHMSKFLYATVLGVTITAGVLGAGYLVLPSLATLMGSGGDVAFGAFFGIALFGVLVLAGSERIDENE